jgi:hypothetical protein
MMTAYMDHKDLTNESIDETRATQIRDGVHRLTPSPKPSRRPVALPVR